MTTTTIMDGAYQKTSAVGGAEKDQTDNSGMHGRQGMSITDDKATTEAPISNQGILTTMVVEDIPGAVVDTQTKNIVTCNQQLTTTHHIINNDIEIAANGQASPPSSVSGRKLPRFQEVVRRIGSTIATTISSAGGNQPKRQEKDFLKAYLKKFDADEVEVLRKVYKELSSRSPGSGIDKETFLQYFPLPGLWGERLFQRFDYKCLGLVDYEEFLVGIAVCCRGTKCERIHVLFQVFDLNGDGVLQRQELVAMLSNLPNLDRYLQKKNTAILEKKGERDSEDQSSAEEKKGTSATIGSSKQHQFAAVIHGSTVTSCNTETLNFRNSHPTDNLPVSEDGKHRCSVDSSAQLPLLNMVEPSDQSTSYPVLMQLSNVQTHLETQSKMHQPEQPQYTNLLDVSGSGGVNIDDELFRSSYRAESDYDEDEDMFDFDDDDEDDVLDDDDDEDYLGEEDQEMSDREIQYPQTKDVDKTYCKDGIELEEYFIGWPIQGGEEQPQKDRRVVTHGMMLDDRQAVAGPCPVAASSSILQACNKSESLQHCYHHSGGGFTTPVGARRRESALSSNGNITPEDISGGLDLPSVTDSLRQRSNNAIDVEAFVDKIIEECEFSDCDSLTFIEFKTWLEKNDAILSMFTDCLHEEAWGLQGNALYRRTGGERVGRRQRRFNIMHRGQCGEDDGSKRGVVEIRPDAFYKVKRLFAIPTNKGIAAMLAAQQQKPFFQKEGRSTETGILHPRLPVAVPSLMRTSSTPPSPTQSTELEQPLNSHDQDFATVNMPGGSIAATSNELQALPLPEPTSAVANMDLEIYPRQTREVLNHQLIDLILASNPDVDINTLEAGRNIVPPQKEILACPSCRSLLVVCPRCHRRSPNIRLKNGSVIIECQRCLEGTPHDFYSCWHCNWNFAEASESVDRSEPLHEGTLYKIGKHTHKWRSRYFVLVDNLLYYYGRKEDTKPKGFFFLEGCFVELINPPKPSKSSPVEGVDIEMGSKGPTLAAGQSSMAPSLIKISVPSTSTKFGFSIAHGGGKVPRRDLYTSREEEREAWMKALRAAMNQQSIEEAYCLGPVLGQGKFSIVYSGWTKDTNQEVAIKVIDKSKISGHERELLRSEIAILRLLRHPHVISLREVLDSQKSIYIVMEYVKGGELYDLLQQKRRLPELHVNRIIFQLLTTVAYLHKCGIIHRDLKPENILLTNKTTDLDIKITDFGLSCICGMDELVTQPCGTLAYVAPEVLTLKGYNHKVDIWSVGVIMYLLLRGRLPFPVGRVSGIAKSSTIYRQLTFDGPVWDNVCSSAKDLLRKLVQANPEKRISAQEALEHLWIKNPTAVISEGLPDESADHNTVQSQQCNNKDILHPGIITDVTPRMKDATVLVQNLHPLVGEGIGGSSAPSPLFPSISDDRLSQDRLSPQLLDVSASTFSVPIAHPNAMATSPTPISIVSHIDGAQIPTTTISNSTSPLTIPTSIPATCNPPPSTNPPPSS